MCFRVNEEFQLWKQILFVGTLIPSVFMHFLAVNCNVQVATNGYYGQVSSSFFKGVITTRFIKFLAAKVKDKMVVRRDM